jgi:hypothetical protein
MNINDKGQVGEDFVNKLAFDSFLKYWCFPGPNDITGDNKEICDLLIIFDEACVIVSVKNYAFSGNYERYFNNTIKKAVKQINGAERKLFGQRAILIQHPDRNAELFPKEEIKDIYRIIVNLNTGVKFYQSSFVENGKPYAVMDAEAWMDAVELLDTIPDFLNYLKRRFEFFGTRPAFIFPREEYDFAENDALAAERAVKEITKETGNLIIINGKEVDLIAYFLASGFSFGNVQEPMQRESLLFSIDGQWDQLRTHPVYQQKLELEKDSYFFDNLVAKHVINTDKGHHLARMLFRFNRLERAQLSREFQKYHEKISLRPNVQVNRTRLIFKDTHFLFIWFSDKVDINQINAFLELAMLHAHYRTKFNNQELGAIALSRSKEHISYGYAKQLKDPSKEELTQMETRFQAEGWDLN